MIIYNKKWTERKNKKKSDPERIRTSILRFKLLLTILLLRKTDALSITPQGLNKNKHIFHLNYTILHNTHSNMEF